jgi:hypothetical protein
MTTFSSPDVMRFLGKHINSNAQLHQNFSGEVVSDFKRRAAKGSGHPIRTGYCTTKVSFVEWVNVVEPDVKVPVTVRL